MLYTREILDRTTGHLVTVPIGDWITVTELGERYGLGRKKIRAILHHMGLLQPERGHYRLPHWAVERGLGNRIERSKSRHPFDVISPLGQQLIAEAWEATVADYDASCRAEAGVDAARAALDAFKARRQSPMTTQEEVCWLLDYRDLPYETIATVLEVDRALVSRYAKRRANDEGYWKRWKQFAPKQSNQPAPPAPKESYTQRSIGLDDEEAIFRRLAT